LWYSWDMKLTGFAQYVQEELLGDISGITIRRMFSGYGVYKDGVVFGMIIDDVLYFKVDDEIKSFFENAQSKPFTYTHKSGKTVTMPYWELPPDVTEDKDELHKWVERSVSVGRKK